MTSNDDDNNKITIIERQIGQRVRSLRVTQGLSLKQLGDLIGVAHPQLMKIEKGKTKITFSRLIMIAEALNKDLSYFYSDLESEMPKEKIDKNQRLCMEVSRNFLKLKSEKAKEAISKLVLALVEMQQL